ncbi:MAG: hypothetical protein R2875_10830 [Desulfobacterales bacterium]
MSPIWSRNPTSACTGTHRKPCWIKMADMAASSQGAPFLINFDERSMAGMMRKQRLQGSGI